MTPYYDQDGITLYLGDCREVTAWLKADVLVTDPPYGVAYKSGWGNKFRDVVIANDETTAARDQALRLWGDKPALVFGSWKMPRPAATRTVLVWDKGTVGMGDLSLPWFPCTEEVYVLGAGWVGSRSSAVLRQVGRNQHHPTEKPLPLLNALIAKCPPGTIADPFAGSGSTLLAARSAGRRAVGVEIEERYCDLIASRLAQGDLFGGAA
ncbi:MAG: site-specific DNA-methyltransferase [Pseudorhodobacter sp.]|nr:site-specific DNA-methyltransferase [Frankiaceae bacterium]